MKNVLLIALLMVTCLGTAQGRLGGGQASFFNDLGLDPPASGSDGDDNGRTAIQVSVPHANSIPQGSAVGVGSIDPSLRDELRGQMNTAPNRAGPPVLYAAPPADGAAPATTRVVGRVPSAQSTPNRAGPPVLNAAPPADGAAPAMNRVVGRVPSALSTNSLRFHCLLEIAFFEHEGRQPEQEEVDTLIEKTSGFLHDLLVHETSFDSLQVNDMQSVYSATGDPDSFSANFSTSVSFAETDDHDRMTMEAIASIVDAADYKLFIRDYIWMTEPLRGNEFYQTHRIRFTCKPS